MPLRRVSDHGRFAPLGALSGPGSVGWCAHASQLVLFRVQCAGVTLSVPLVHDVGPGEPSHIPGTVQLIYAKKKDCLKDISPFCAVTDTLLLDFGWRLPRVSEPGWLRGLSPGRKNMPGSLESDVCRPTSLAARMAAEFFSYSPDYMYSGGTCIVRPLQFTRSDDCIWQAALQ